MDFKLNVDLVQAQTGVKDLVASIDRLNQSITQLEQKTTASFNKSAAGARKVKSALTEQEQEYKRLGQQIATLQSKRSSLDNKQKKNLSDLIQRQRQLGVEMQKAGNKGAVATQKVTAAQAGLNKQVSLGRQLFLRLKSVMLTVFGAYAIIQGIRNTINTIKEFELGVARVQAITGATSKEIEKLSNSAKILAQTGIFNPTEITELQVKLAKLGFTIDEIANSTEGIINLATATGEDLAVAAELVASVIRGLGLEADETGRIVDVLGKSFTSSALDINKFRESAKYILPLARQMGWSIEEVAAVLGKLSDSLISGSLAGTGLRTLFIELGNSSSELSLLMGTNIKTFDEFVDALVKMQEEGVSLDEILAAVPKRAVTLTTVLLAQGESLRDYAKEMKNASGAIKEMADIQMDTLANQLDRLSASWDSFILALKESGGILTRTASILADVLNLWAFQMNPASVGIERAAGVVNQLKQAISDLDDEAKSQKVTQVIQDLSEVILELDGVTRKSEGIIAFLASLREQVKLLQELKGEINIDKDIAKISDEITKRANELEQNGIPPAKAFEQAYREAITRISNTIKNVRKDLEKESDNISTIIGVSTEFDTEAQAQLDAEAQARINHWTKVLGALQQYFFEELKLKEDSDALSKETEKNLLAYQKQLELQNANLIANTRKREETILEINARYSKLNYQLDLKYDDLTLKERNLIYALIESGEKNFQNDLLNLKTKYHEQDLDEARKNAEAQLKIQEDLFAIRIQEMKNAGASEQEIQREILKQDIEILKIRIQIAKATGASADEIVGYANAIDLIGAKLDGITDDDVVEKVEDNTKRIGAAYKKLATEILDSLSTIVDAQVENSTTLVSDLNSRISEVQSDLERETELYTEGYANNVTAKTNELNDLKAIREQAIKDRDAAVRRQQAIEAVSQAVDLASAVANTINIYSEIPWVGYALAAAAVAGFLALFATAKSSAKAAASYGSGGEIDGEPHSRGGVMINAEGGEYVVRKSAYAKHADLVRAINEDNLPKLNAEVLNNTTIDKNGDVIINNEIWNKMYDLWDKNLNGDRVEISGNKKIITRGSKKRIVNV